MKKRVLAYLKYIDELLETDNANWDEEIKKHLVQIGFFAHERLVHLIVTVLFALMTMASILYCNYTGSMIALTLTVALLVLLIPYIMHYYLLENSVQKMYVQYDAMMNKTKEAFSTMKE
ncbi:MAG: hypothetical protein E7257_10335 [Lachnospiraceae bacterium]|nr:hypothetical protein [Lachnospiraceae bacterium]